MQGGREGGREGGERAESVEGDRLIRHMLNVDFKDTHYSHNNTQHIHHLHIHHLRLTYNPQSLFESFLSSNPLPDCIPW